MRAKDTIDPKQTNMSTDVFVTRRPTCSDGINCDCSSRVKQAMTCTVSTELQLEETLVLKDISALGPFVPV